MSVEYVQTLKIGSLCQDLYGVVTHVHMNHTFLAQIFHCRRATQIETGRSHSLGEIINLWMSQSQCRHFVVCKRFFPSFPGRKEEEQLDESIDQEKECTCDNNPARKHEIQIETAL